jgi:hypothetical protein
MKFAKEEMTLLNQGLQHSIEGERERDRERKKKSVIQE